MEGSIPAGLAAAVESAHSVCTCAASQQTEAVVLKEDTAAGALEAGHTANEAASRAVGAITVSIVGTTSTSVASKDVVQSGAISQP
jgi:hypothetical protein